MNNNNNNKKKKNNNNNNKNLINYRKRQKNSNKSFRINRFQQSTRPATYGPGTYRFCVTKLISGSLSSQVHFLGYLDILKDNPELERVMHDFKYFKLLNMSITFYSRNLPVEGNQTPCYFLVNYDGYTTPNLRLQDNVKVIPAFLTVDKMFKYNIPTIHATTMLLNAWCTISDFSNFDEIVLQFHAPDNTQSWYIRVDFNMICRGPTNTTTKEIELNDFKMKYNDKIKNENNKDIDYEYLSGNDDNSINEGKEHKTKLPYKKGVKH